MSAHRNSTVVKVLHGTARADRTRDEAAVRPAGTLDVDPIFDLDPTNGEVAMFKWIVDNMSIPVIHARGDGLLLARFAKAMVMLRECEAKLRQHGPVMRSATGRPELQPYYYAVSQANDMVRKMANDLGLTPLGRMRFAPDSSGREGNGSAWDAIS